MNNTQNEIDYTEQDDLDISIPEYPKMTENEMTNLLDELSDEFTPDEE